MHDLMNNVCSFLFRKCKDPEFIKTLEFMVFSKYNICSVLQIAVLKFQKSLVTYPKSLIPSVQTTARAC